MHTAMTDVQCTPLTTSLLPRCSIHEDIVTQLDIQPEQSEGSTPTFVRRSRKYRAVALILSGCKSFVLSQVEIRVQCERSRDSKTIVVDTDSIYRVASRFFAKEIRGRFKNVG